MINIDININIVCEIITRAQECHAKEGVVFPENTEDWSEDDLMQVLADHKNDLSWLELKDAIDNLEPDQQTLLVAMMYLGRGDYSLEEWEDCLSEARRLEVDSTSTYLLTHPYLSSFLENGLDSLGYSCQE